MNYSIFEILDGTEKAKGKEDKITFLCKHKDNVALKVYLTWGLDPRVQWNLPEGSPPYRESVTPPGMGDTNLYFELRRLSGLIKGNPNELKVKALAIESLFIGILEGLEKGEAKVLLAVKNKTLSDLFPSVTIPLVNEAFPDIKLPEPKNEEIEPKKETLTLHRKEKHGIKE